VEEWYRCIGAMGGPLLDFGLRRVIACHFYAFTLGSSSSRTVFVLMVITAVVPLYSSNRFVTHLYLNTS
jgi:hypothetical protein